MRSNGFRGTEVPKPTLSAGSSRVLGCFRVFRVFWEFGGW